MVGTGATKQGESQVSWHVSAAGAVVIIKGLSSGAFGFNAKRSSSWMLVAL